MSILFIFLFLEALVVVPQGFHNKYQSNPKTIHNMNRKILLAQFFITKITCKMVLKILSRYSDSLKLFSV